MVANEEQIRLWNEQSGPRWVAMHARLDAQLRPFGDAAVARLGLTEGARVLDVGCGCGDTSVRLAQTVGSAGRVLGVDVSRPMLERARERGAVEGLAQLSFVEGDAETHAFEPASFDALFSRFGVMFFGDPARAFANLRAALVPGARLAFVCWRGIERNEWMTVPLRAALAHVPPPSPPVPDAPGPFGFAREERVRAVLGDAGFSAVELTSYDEPLSYAGGGTLDDAVELAVQIGPLGVLLREHPDARAAVVGSVREVLSAHQGERGIEFAASAWVVTARA